MKHANKIVDIAFSYFRIGYNYAESLLLAIGNDDALKINSDLIPKITTGFGGGIKTRIRLGSSEQCYHGLWLEVQKK
jgi:hypothetical protein